MTGIPAHPVIGVIGGMGPEATVELMRRVIATTPVDDDFGHIHMIVDNNPKVPSRIAALIERTGDDPSPEIVRMAIGLEKAGATVLVMPCNTAHAYATKISSAVTIPFLDMLCLTAARIEQMILLHGRVGVLASTAVKQLELFEAVLTPIKIELVWPEDQGGVMDVIRNVKRGDASPTNRDRFRKIAEGLLDRKVDLLLIACTDLSVLVGSLDHDTPIVDSLDVLTEEIVRCGLRRKV
jgi:aspartate racemase